ncbi:T9SS type B sorting domain-containing protein [Aestuariivivens sp. NBU2969]|uniref:T9SS type B sorting domain-containing protein n=1 Tax=Aestuariivivens sp. NBU2969 TaxID=2873267 RepID=UPI0027154FDC|nr:choice-of-anchor L domain-containing protein [Aestuariivivens sp. NBU2969]
MKKNIYILLVIGLFYFKSNAQIISVNDQADIESGFSLSELVEQVLMPSDCFTVDTFSSQVKGTPSQLTTKSYGYFKKPLSSDFPFENGIIITNGRAHEAGNVFNNAPGAYPSNDNGLPGDADLENALRQGSTFDATYVKFNFTPLINTVSFRFLMASEEYDGSTECVYADSFAFLLREVGTTQYRNLAVLPSGQAVSVTNINGSRECSSNTDLFEGYNLPDTNYGGRTKVLTAKANVEPDKTYEIKIVVADQGDAIWDSAIFLEAGSFNIGGNLGPDRTVRSGNPVCSGTPFSLDVTLNIPGTTYKWFKNGVEILGETNSIYNVTEDGIYGVEIDIARKNCVISDDIRIEFAQSPIVFEPPKNMVLCNTDEDLIGVFDFNENKNIVLGPQREADFIMSFHLSEEDARSNDNPITSPEAYTNTQEKETIWIRIAERTQTCFEVVSFNISVIKETIANTPLDYDLCDDVESGSNSDGLALFDLSTKVDEILGDQPSLDYEVRFYQSQDDASIGLVNTQIGSLIQNMANPQTVYARVENKVNPTCFGVTAFNLVVNSLPVINSNVSLIQCDDDNDGFTIFNLTEANTLVSSNSINETFTYYESEAGAKDALAIDQITNVLDYSNKSILNDKVYVRVENSNGCYRIATVDLLVSATQIPKAFNLTFQACDDKTLDNDSSNGITTFNFSEAQDKIKSLFPNNGQELTISYYTSEIDALSEINAIADIGNHRNETSPIVQQIYVRVDSNITNSCLGLGSHITLIVKPIPLQKEISDYVLCGNDDFSNFNLTTKNTEIIGSQTTPILISYHVTKQDALDNIPITNDSNYLNTSNPQTIYVRAQFDENGNGVSDINECFNIDMSFNLIVNKNPIIFEPESIKKCSDDVTAEYDLTIREEQITGGDGSIELAYFETLLDLENNNPITKPKNYLNTVLDKDIIVLATGSNRCSSTVNLSLKTILYGNLNSSPLPIEACEINKADTALFDLTIREDEILNGLNASDYIFTYYINELDALARNNSIIEDPNNFENNIPTLQTIYANVKFASNECFIVVPIKLVVNHLPKIRIEEEYVICLNNNNEVLDPVNTPFLSIPPIDTQLDITEYTFQWFNATVSEAMLDPIGTVISGATSSYYTPTKPGHYTVLVTNRTTGCDNMVGTEVVGSYPPETISIELLTQTFSKNNSIEVMVVGLGEYEFRLNDGLWQSSNVFERIAGGEHTIYVRDLLNCNEISEIKIIIDYPKFFTPNGDGFNDTWNIKGIADYPNSEIYIFDRYGKLLKQLNPNGIGWDGTFNGDKQPSDDYWFTVKYYEPLDNIQKVFRAHFTLKR